MKKINKFTWGDSVKVLDSAPLEFLPNNFGAVCGVYELTNKEKADAHGYPIGTVVYTVEFADGSDLEIPEYFLELDA